MKRSSSPLVLLAGALALAACDGGGGGGGGGTGTEPGGEYRAVLQSPNGAEGAAAIELTGAGIESIAAAGGRLFTSVSGNTARVVVVNEPAGEIAFRVTMAAGNGPPAARVVEVVSRDDQPQASLAGYVVTFKR